MVKDKVNSGSVMPPRIRTKDGGNSIYGFLSYFSVTIRHCQTTRRAPNETRKRLELAIKVGLDDRLDATFGRDFGTAEGISINTENIKIKK